MTQLELNEVMTEYNKIKYTLQAEQKQLKETLKEKKNLISHLQQSIVDNKNEYEKKEKNINKQIIEYKEKIIQHEHEKKNLNKEIQSKNNDFFKLEKTNIDVSKFNMKIFFFEKTHYSLLYVN
jgi:peptidoglycan hydrolase CwlO-like protein